MFVKDPWYVRRLSAFDPFKSKHAGGRRGKKAKRKGHLARVARAITNHWPRGRR